MIQKISHNKNNKPGREGQQFIQPLMEPEQEVCKKVKGLFNTPDTIFKLQHNGLDYCCIIVN